MKAKTALCTLLTLLLCLSAVAASAQDIKARMIARVPEIDALLAQGAVGENNVGLLEYRGSAAGIPVVDAENSDRRTIYQAIARKNGTTMVVVGGRRAVRLHQHAPPGTWLQSPEGRWYRK